MAPPSPNAAGRALIDRAIESGFALAGVTPARPTDHAQAYQQWLAAGRHGEMDYLARNVAQRLDPAQMVPGAVSILCVADRYPFPQDEPPEDGPAHHGRVAAYAHGDDYHKAIKKRLHRLADTLLAEHPDHTFRSAVDTAPVLEREHASRAGIGWTGKHTLTISPTHGSYLLLGEIITTLPLTESAEHRPPPMDDHCGTCTRCIDACPTQCIAPEGYTLDATRCISYLTLEHRSPIEPELFPQMGDWIAGCDVCQHVCPHNAKALERLTAGTLAPSPDTYEPRNTAFDLLKVLNWTEDDRRAAFRGSALKRMKLPMVQRNALIAAGNQLSKVHNAALLERIQQLADDEQADALVRDTAKAVLQELQNENQALSDKPQ